MDRVVVSAGFPRSGSTFIMNCLVNAFPDNRILPLSHETIRLREYGCIVPIRSPLETIPSASLFFNEKDINGIIKWHNRFFNAILKNIEKIVLVDFYSLINDPNKEMYKIGKVYNIQSKNFDHSNFLKNENKNKYNRLSIDDEKIKDSINLYNNIYSLCKKQELMIY